MPSRISLWPTPNKVTGKHNIYIDLQYGRGNRKRVRTKILVEKRHWGSRGLKRNHPNYKTIKKALSEYEKRIEIGEDRYLTNQINLDQFKLLVEGKSDFSSVLSYIDTEIKNSRSPVTYEDYRSTFLNFKKHLNLSNRKLKFEDLNIKLLKDFKINYLKLGRSNNGFNSIIDKIRAIYNDAYENGVIHKKFEMPSRFKMPKTRTEFSVCSFDEFKDAIDKVNTQLEWESLVMWLLQFCMRGIYFKDLSSISEKNIENYEDEYQTWCIDNNFVIKHNRHKVKNRISAPMYIKIDNYPTKQLFYMLKYSFALRYWNTDNRDKVGDINDILSIYNYNAYKNENEEKFHKQMVNSYQKAIRRILNHPMKNARKSFKTIANSLSSVRISELLIGHSGDTQQNAMSYNDDSFEDIVKQVYDTHTSVLRRFKASELCQLLQDKLVELTEKKVMPEWILGWCLNNDSNDGIYLYDFDYDNNYKGYFGKYDMKRFSQSL
jgi:hypothetical protein